MTAVLTVLARHWKAFAVAGLLILVFLLGARHGAAGPRQELAEQRADHSRQVAEWERLRAVAAADAIRRQTDLQDSVDRARANLEGSNRTIAAQAARIAVLSSDSDRLRGKLATYAAGRSGQDTLAACHARAGTLANLLAEGAGLVVEGANLARECSIDHDRRAAEVNALLSAWPANRVAVH
jgi:hypothetical protein